MEAVFSFEDSVVPVGWSRICDRKAVDCDMVGGRVGERRAGERRAGGRYGSEEGAGV